MAGSERGIVTGAIVITAAIGTDASKRAYLVSHWREFRKVEAHLIDLAIRYGGVLSSSTLKVAPDESTHAAAPHMQKNQTIEIQNTKVVMLHHGPMN